jgi:TPR repeat protein
MKRSLAARYMKLSADQGFGEPQCSYSAILCIGDGILMNKLLAAHYLKLSADRGNSEAHFPYSFCLFGGNGCEEDHQTPAEYIDGTAASSRLRVSVIYSMSLATPPVSDALGNSKGVMSQDLGESLDCHCNFAMTVSWGVFIHRK